MPIKQIGNVYYLDDLVWQGKDPPPTGARDRTPVAAGLLVVLGFGVLLFQALTGRGE